MEPRNRFQGINSACLCSLAGRYDTLCHSFYHLLFLTSIRTIQSYVLSSFVICRGPSSCIFIAPLSKRSLLGVPSRESNSGLPYSKPTHYQLNCAAPYWTAPHPSELRRTLLNCAAPYWTAPHPDWTAPHPTECVALLNKRETEIFSQIFFQTLLFRRFSL